MDRITKIILLAALALVCATSTASAATPSVRLGNDYACALAEAGTVSCWGGNARGQLGDGTNTDSVAPVAVKDVANAVQIDAGMYQACALIADGTVKCWGATVYGALGTAGPSTPTGTATTIAGLSGVAKISVGEATVCAILSSPAGTVKCWGYGSAGQLGVAAPPSYTATPQAPNLGGPATDIGVGEFHACAVVAAALKCWGSNNNHEILPGGITKYETPQSIPSLSSGVGLALAGDAQTCAVMLSGAVKCWGPNYQGQNGTGVSGGASTTAQDTLVTSGATAVGYGDNHTCALIGDSAKCWGDNGRGQIGDGGSTFDDRPTPTTPTGLASGVTSIDAGGEATCAIVNKSVLCWGDNTAGALGNGTSANHNSPVTVVGVTGATDVDVSNDHGCAVASGQLKCWGSNNVGGLGTGSDGGIETTPVAATTFGPGQTAVAAAYGTTCSVDSGAVKCAGYGWYGQLGNGTSSNSTPTAVLATLAGTSTKVFAASSTLCALNAGKVYCWGTNDSSLLGQGAGQDQGTLSFLSTPADVDGIASGATAMDMSYTHACAVVSGALKCWGQNYGGAVTGTSTSGQFPAIQTPGLSGVSTAAARTVAVAYGTTCAIVTSPAGGVKCFGENNNGTFGDGTTTGSYTPVLNSITGATAIAAGDSNFCVVVSGSVKCWGRNDTGQLGNGTNIDSKVPVTVSGISDAVSVTGQRSSYCAVLSSGGVKCWGEGYYGQLGGGGSVFSTVPSVVTGLTLFPPDPVPYVKQKIKPTLKLNGKVKRKASKISVPLKLYFKIPAGANPATVCAGNTTISVKSSKKTTTKLRVKFKRKSSNCSYTGTIKLPKSFKGKKTKFVVSIPENADVLKYKSTKTLKLK